MATPAEMAAIRSEVEKRSRFSQILSLVEPPEDDELDAAIYDALDDINSLEPSTNYSLENIIGSTDTRWKRLLYLGAAHNAVGMLLKDWTANGIDVDLGDGVALASKLSDYQTLHSDLKDEFDDKLEKLKTAALKISRVSHFSTGHGLNSLSTGSFSKRARRYRQTSRIN